ncbi:hypothetical protein BD413DRAFT_606013 [Trametes elegans]|nr:hypothetical protein BD413DRAFT_606013 [Trametes elegans]
MTTKSPLFNSDVLNILAVSDPTTICRLVQVTRELYRARPKYLLKDVVNPRRECSVPFFVSFMSQSEAKSLETFLLQSASLLIIRCLDIKCAEDFSESSPSLLSCFALLRILTSLRVEEIGRCTNSFLRQLQADLVADPTMIQRPFDSHSDADSYLEDEDEDDPAIRIPILQLTNSQDSLRLLVYSMCDTFGRWDVLYDQRYPDLKMLTLNWNEVPSTAHYARAFPTLATLTLSTSPRELHEVGATFERLYEQRSLNKITQILFGRWERLRAVYGTRSSITSSSPRCNLQGFDVDLFFCGECKRLMRGQLLRPARCFEIALVFGSVVMPSTAVDVPTALVVTIPPQRDAIAPLTMACYALVTPRGPGEKPARPTELATLCAAEEYLRDLDLHVPGVRIREAAPALQTLVITLLGHSARPNARVTSGEDVVYEDGAVERIHFMAGYEFPLSSPAFLQVARAKLALS